MCGTVLSAISAVYLARVSSVYPSHMHMCTYIHECQLSTERGTKITNTQILTFVNI